MRSNSQKIIGPISKFISKPQHTLPSLPYTSRVSLRKSDRCPEQSLQRPQSMSDKKKRIIYEAVTRWISSCQSRASVHMSGPSVRPCAMYVCARIQGRSTGNSAIFRERKRATSHCLSIVITLNEDFFPLFSFVRGVDMLISGTNWIYGCCLSDEFPR